LELLNPLTKLDQIEPICNVKLCREQMVSSVMHVSCGIVLYLFYLIFGWLFLPSDTDQSISFKQI